MQLHDERDRSKAPQRLSLTTRLKRRWLWGLTYYPMVLLLAFVLVSVHIVEYLGLAAWIIAAGTLITILLVVHYYRSSIQGPENRKLQATPFAIICMMGISGAYAIVHHQSRANAR
ncbi:MAG: hypothetical protein MUF23_12800, partial [Pirellula sp.]|nr:hypothetical protein [Pirellula sp.]